MNNSFLNPFIGNAKSNVGYHGGASPTEYFIGQQMMNGMMQMAKQQGNMFTEHQQIRTSSSPSYGRVGAWSPSYSDLHVAACNGQQVTTRHLLESNQEMSEVNQQDRHGNSALHWAVSEGHPEVAKTLLENGADPNLQNVHGETAVFIAATRGNALLEALVQLLQSGANPNLANLEDATPLHLAAANGHLEVLKVLLQYGAFIHAQDEEGDSVLHYAVREGKVDVVAFLIQVFPTLTQIKNEDDESAYDLAVSIQDSRMINLLNAKI